MVSFNVLQEIIIVAMLHSALCIYLSMFVSELESLEKSQSLIHISSNGEIIDSNLPQFALRINDEQTSEGEALVLLEHPRPPRRVAVSHAAQAQLRNLEPGTAQANVFHRTVPSGFSLRER